MPRRTWSKPFSEIRAAILAAVREQGTDTGADLAAVTGLPFEDVISALRLLRRQGELDFEPVWERDDVMSDARNIRLRAAADDAGPAAGGTE
jgi:hypothetical protein